MGLGPNWSFDRTYIYDPIPKGNPDPKNYMIHRSYKSNNTVLDVEYPNCTNYEGRKILLVIGTPNIYDLDTLDPHFSEEERGFRLFARFEPTDRGWEIACYLADKENLVRELDV